jgi:hypothetical protein
MAGSTFSVLGADTAIKGDISASADLHIDGKVEGDIACAALVQGESSEIVGAVTPPKAARLAGTVRGSITARELVILKHRADHRRRPLRRADHRTGRAGRRPLSPALRPDPAGGTHLTLASST